MKYLKLPALVMALLVALSGGALGFGALEPAAQLASQSNLPVISISTDTGDMPTGEDSYARMTIYASNGWELTRATARVEVRERGNTSKRFPKKSYKIRVVDEFGDKHNMSILGLRSDDDWILNPMYSDTSKIREALAYSLWQDMNSSGVYAQSSRVKYAEVYINGEYWGLYGVQERIDRKQVGGDKHTGVLYKITANARPTALELRAHDSLETLKGIELEFCGEGVSSPWSPAADYIAVFDGEARALECHVARANAIDFGLFIMLTQAHDCHFKNQFLNCVAGDESYTLYKIPWDLNDTFGDVWRNSAQDTNYTGYVLSNLVMEDYFELLLAQGDEEITSALKARWANLREALITEQALISRAHDIYTPLFDAIVRDSERWPEGGMGNGNARNIRDIEAFIRDILPRMDAYIYGL